MNLTDIIQREPNPKPWAEGEKIPWHEPEFSRRMLAEHLSQAHDKASRRSHIIDQHVSWIHQAILDEKPAQILDLGCGPGFYCHRLAKLGHTCTGIDFSPASIAYAHGNRLPNTRYIEEDIREAEYGSGYNLAMLLYGEFNVFRPKHARIILKKTFAALDEGGSILLEPHTFDCVKDMGQAPPTWYHAKQGVFSDLPYLCLMENFWHPEPKVTVERFYVIDGETSAVNRYTQSIQAYTDQEYTRLLQDVGYRDVCIFPSLTGAATGESTNLLVITARKATPTSE